MTLKNNLFAGIDIGGTNTVIGFVDSNAEIIFRDTLPTKNYQDPLRFVETIAGKIDLFLNTNQKYSLAGIGIGAPNGNFYKGTIEFAPNLNWEGIVPLVSFFEKYFSVDIKLTNDANAAAFGEKIYGSAQKMNDFIFITLGTGVGSGIVSNGQLIYGHDGFAGELGHVIVEKNGRLCACGRHGCLEAYCSAGGLVQTYQELRVDENIESYVTAHQVYELAVGGDLTAIEAFNITAEKLGFALANFVNFSSPEAIFLFGGLANAGDLIFKPTYEAMEQNLLKIYKGKVKLLPSGLPESDAAILGAAALVSA